MNNSKGSEQTRAAIIGGIFLIISACIGGIFLLANTLVEKGITVTGPSFQSAGNPQVQAVLGTPTTQVVQIIPADTPGYDLTCRGKESGAVISNVVIPASDWQTDCAYKYALDNGTIMLTTWGILLDTDGVKVLSAQIISPGIVVNVTRTSVLFAGYQSEQAVRSAYLIRNPNAPTPSP